MSTTLSRFGRVVVSRKLPWLVALFVAALIVAALIARDARGAAPNPPASAAVANERQVLLEPAAAAPTRQAMLGVVLANQEDGAQEDGVAVPQLYVGGPAQRAGVQAGDVIVAINGQAVRTDQDVINIVSQLPPNTPVDLLISRRGWTSHVTVTLGDRTTVGSLPRTQTAAQAAAQAAAAQAAAVQAAAVQAATAQRPREARRFSYVGSDRGVTDQRAIDIYDPYWRALNTAFGP